MAIKGKRIKKSSGTKRFTVRISKEVYDFLREEGMRIGIGVTQVARMWLARAAQGRMPERPE